MSLLLLLSIMRHWQRMRDNMCPLTGWLQLARLIYEIIDWQLVDLQAVVTKICGARHLEPEIFGQSFQP